VDRYERQNIEGNAYRIRVEKGDEFGGDGTWREVNATRSNGHEIGRSHESSKEKIVFSTARVCKSTATVYRKPHSYWCRKCNVIKSDRRE
jgi:hypothetical protein